MDFSDCDIVAGDDDFAFYAAENVSVSNCSLGLTLRRHPTGRFALQHVF